MSFSAVTASSRSVHFYKPILHGCNTYCTVTVAASRHESLTVGELRDIVYRQLGNKFHVRDIEIFYSQTAVEDEIRFEIVDPITNRSYIRSRDDYVLARSALIHCGKQDGTEKHPFRFLVRMINYTYFQVVGSDGKRFTISISEKLIEKTSLAFFRYIVDEKTNIDTSGYWFRRPSGRVWCDDVESQTNALLALCDQGGIGEENDPFLVDMIRYHYYGFEVIAESQTLYFILEVLACDTEHIKVSDVRIRIERSVEYNNRHLLPRRFSFTNMLNGTIVDPAREGETKLLDIIHKEGPFDSRESPLPLRLLGY